MEYVITLPPDLGISAEEIVAAWQDEVKRQRDGEPAEVDLPDATVSVGKHLPEMVSMDPITGAVIAVIVVETVLHLGIGVASHGIIALIESIFEKKEAEPAKKVTRRSYKSVRSTLPNGTTIESVVYEETVEE